MKKRRLEKFKENNLFKLSFLILCYFLLILVLFNLLKLCKYDGSLLLVQIISIIIPFGYLVFKERKEFRNVLIIGIPYLVIIVLLPFIFSYTYDFTIDGNSYHKTAIAYLKDGWNPIYEDSLDFQKKSNAVAIKRVDKWMDHYPKSSWIIAATLYSMTGSVESGKAISLTMILVMAFISYSYFSTFLSKRKSCLLAVLLAINPIYLAQIFNYYVDLLMGCCFVIQLVLLLLIDPTKKQDKIIWISLMSVVAIFVNLKFTGLLYSGVIAAVFYFYWIFKYRQKKNRLNYFLNITTRFVIVYLVAILLVGSSSYVKNTIDHHNPLYPLIGKGKVDIVTTMQSKEFKDLNMFQKATWSLFSKTENVTYDSAPKLKLPFMVYRSEIDSLMLPDIRIAGFGPLFSLILIISVVSLIIHYVLQKKEKKKSYTELLVLLAIVVSCVAVGEMWWARYVPQAFLIPIISILVIFKGNYKKFNYVAYLIAILIIINSCLFIPSINDKLIAFKQTTADLRELSTKKKVEFKMSDLDTYGVYYNLKDYNINYKEIKKIKEDKIKWVFSLKVQVKLDD